MSEIGFLKPTSGLQADMLECRDILRMKQRTNYIKGRRLNMLRALLILRNMIFATYSIYPYSKQFPMVKNH